MVMTSLPNSIIVGQVILINRTSEKRHSEPLDDKIADNSVYLP